MSDKLFLYKMHRSDWSLRIHLNSKSLHFPNRKALLFPDYLVAAFFLECLHTTEVNVASSIVLLNKYAEGFSHQNRSSSLVEEDKVLQLGSKALVLFLTLSVFAVK